jgi:hypothetical protein
MASRVSRVKSPTDAARVHARETTLPTTARAARIGYLFFVIVFMGFQEPWLVRKAAHADVAYAMYRRVIRGKACPALLALSAAQAAIYDGWACAGSANLEKMSLRVSQELDVPFSDPATVEKLKQDLFEADFKRSRELKNPVVLDWLDSLVKAFANQL